MSGRDATGYFTRLADVYDRHRPSYPPEAIAAALDGLSRPTRVIDVGCGTGICTRLLAAAGAHATGVDANDDMLAQARAHPGPPVGTLDYRSGRAETLPAPDAACELVLCAQSFHWFDASPALTEFARVLAPGGRLALLWNVRQTSDDLTRAYEDVVRRAQDDAAGRGLVVHRARSFRLDHTTASFGPARTLRFPNPQRVDRAGLLGRVRSASYFPREGPLRDALEAELTRHFDRHESGGFVTLHQDAELTLADVQR